MIETIFITALIVLFIYECTREGMIFESIGNKLKPLPDFIKKPLYDCPICMVPWHGSLLIFIGNTANVWHVHNPVEWVFILFAGAGINTVLIYIIDQGKAITKSLNESDCNCTKRLTEEEKSEQRRKRIEQHTK